MNLSDNEKRDVIKYLEAGKPLPEKYRFLLFDDDREVELVWNGKMNEVTNTVLPFQTIEHIDEPRSEDKKTSQHTLFDTSGRQIKGWTNKLIWGDNKLILSSLKNGPMRKEIEAQGGLKLIYIDPPFDVGADFSMNIEIGDETFTKKPSVIEEIAYRDTWGKGADSFIAMIYERLKLMHDLLAEDGSIYVHCDYRVSGYMRLILDEVFGKENIVNEIIWWYKRWTAAARNYQRMHDTIFYYKKSENKIFNMQYQPLAASTQAVHGSVRRINIFDEKGRMRTQRTEEESKGVSMHDVWEVPFVVAHSPEQTDYPTQKPELLIERIIKSSSNEDDLIADFFCGSGTTVAVAEKLGRKWIGTDLGRFSVHTTRKRMVGVQRELKKEGKNYRAFEILNIGKYEREYYVNHVSKDLREEEKKKIRERKEKEYINLILSAYKAEAVESFNAFVGKKRDRLVAIGPINMPVTTRDLDFILEECIIQKITKVDILGFEWEMGMDLSRAKEYGIDVQLKVIPREVFDKKAVEKGQVRFYDVAYLEVKPVVKGRGNKKTISVELVDFSVFYNQEDIGEVEENLRSGGSKIVIENGHAIKLSKEKGSEIIKKEQLTKNWTDWVDYWAVDFDFENRKEIVKVTNPETGEEKEEWTGGYIFENEWQSFRTKKDKKLELTTSEKEITTGGRCKVAIKVVDIFGNDTTKVIEVKI